MGVARATPWYGSFRRIIGLAAKFHKRFESETGTISCRELSGLDLNAQEDMAKLMSSDIPQTVCFPAVATAYRVVVDLLRARAKTENDAM